MAPRLREVRGVSMAGRFGRERATLYSEATMAAPRDIIRYVVRWFNAVGMQSRRMDDVIARTHATDLASDPD